MMPLDGSRRPRRVDDAVQVAVRDACDAGDGVVGRAPTIAGEAHDAGLVEAVVPRRHGGGVARHGDRPQMLQLLLGLEQGREVLRVGDEDRAGGVVEDVLQHVAAERGVHEHDGGAPVGHAEEQLDVLEWSSAA